MHFLYFNTFHNLLWKLPKIKWNSVKLIHINIATIGYTVRDYRANVLMAMSKRLGDWLTLFTECVAVREVMLMTI